MKCQCSVWVTLCLSGITILPIVAITSEALACPSEFGECYEFDDTGKDDDKLSLLQFTSTARKSSHEQYSLELKHRQRAFKQKGASHHIFPKHSSSSDEVKQFLIEFGESAAGDRMQAEKIDGNAFLHMNLTVLQHLGVSGQKAAVLLERLETARSQADLRQSLMDMAKRGIDFTGNSTLHEIVGADGVLMITLDRMNERFNQSARLLKKIGVNPLMISAVDSASASKEELARGCPKQNDPGVKEWCQKPASRPEGRAGYGCEWPTEQAVAASHRKALERARERNAEWTAILEDDSVPAPVANWNDALRDLWGQLPSRVKLVRLGWCQIGTMDWPEAVIRVPHANTSSAVLLEKEGCCGTMLYEPGGCTTAYLVHRDIIDDMLNLFPCCGPVDSCYKWDLFKAYNPDSKHSKGLDMMMSIDSHNKPLWDGKVEHHGLILQDRVLIESAQDMPWEH